MFAYLRSISFAFLMAAIFLSAPGNIFCGEEPSDNAQEKRIESGGDKATEGKAENGEAEAGEVKKEVTTPVDEFEPPAGWGSRDAEGLSFIKGDPYIAYDEKEKAVYIRAQLSPDARGVYTVLEFFLLSAVKRVNQQTEAVTWSCEQAYESAFITRAQPQSISYALIKTGVKPGRIKQPKVIGLTKGTMGGQHAGAVDQNEGKGERPIAGLLDMIIEWKHEGKYQSMRAEKFLTERKGEKTPADTPWAFTGSFIFTHPKYGKVYAADQYRHIAGTFYDETAIINLPYYTLNPHRSDGGLELNSYKLPKEFSKEKVIYEGYNKKIIRVPVHKFVVMKIVPSKLKMPDGEKAAEDVKANGEDNVKPASKVDGDKGTVEATVKK